MEIENLNERAGQEIAANESKLRKYVSLLSAANEMARLTGPSDEETLWNEHILDCAMMLAMTPDKGRAIDVGTGGGLPGVVLAICRPDLEVTLLDSITRKCAQVEKICIALGLRNAKVVCVRSEDYAKEHPEKFSLVTARAVTSAGILAELLAPFAKTKGKIVAFKGPRVTEELETVGNKWSRIGLSSPKLTPYTLGDKKRFLLVWEKIGQAPKGIPRRPGMAEKFPWYLK